MKYLILILPAVIPAIVFGCGPTSDPEPHITPQPGVEMCDAACQAMREKLHPQDAGPDAVGCPEGEDIVMPDGGVVSCKDFCVYQHENGIYWNTNCIANQITYCEEIETVCNVQ